MIDVVITIARLHENPHHGAYVETQVKRFEFEREADLQNWLMKGQEGALHSENLTGKAT
jgi:hypothetical protein